MGRASMKYRRSRHLMANEYLAKNVNGMALLKASAGNGGNGVTDNSLNEAATYLERENQGDIEESCLFWRRRRYDEGGMP